MTINKRRRKLSGDSGASLVEFALAFPIWFLAVMGVVELSVLLYGQHTITQSVAAANRELTLARGEHASDVSAVSGLFAAATDTPGLRVDRVVVYQPSDIGAPPPAECQAGTSVEGVCVVYDSADASSFGCGETANDNFWCPTSRQGGSPIGVWVSAAYEPISGLLPAYTFDRSATLLIEEELR